LVLPWDRTFTSLLLMIFYDSQNWFNLVFLVEEENDDIYSF
jgi:hypothetical protein